MSNLRADAATIVLAMRQQGVSLNGAFTDTSPPFLKELVYGVTRWYWRLESFAHSLLHKPLRNKDADLMSLILVGLYQLWKLDVPHHAAINETVDACNQLQKTWAKNLVNAVLRGYLRKQDVLDEGISEAARYSHPDWLVRHVRNAWPDYWQTILSANNERAPMVLRVNVQRMDRARYIEELDACGIVGNCDHLSEHGVVLAEPVSVHTLPGFAEGWVSVQDSAAQWAAQILPLSKGQRVLDACAAPGGKLTHILELYPEAGRVLAIDSNAERLGKIRENLQRISVDADLMVADARQTENWWDGNQFDCVVVDAPCTGSGVLRRRPDIKHLRRATDLSATVEIQMQILSRLWEIVVPGGYLLYITCSIFPEENRHQVEKFSKQHDDVEFSTLQPPAGLCDAFGVQTLPGVHETDGFYFSLMHKRAV